jgi:hypothetical protein
MGEETVGSGVLLASERVEGSDAYVTYVVTAWHVIRDIQTAPESTRTPIPVAHHRWRPVSKRFPVGSNSRTVFTSSRMQRNSAGDSSRSSIRGARPVGTHRRSMNAC